MRYLLRGGAAIVVLVTCMAVALDPPPVASKPASSPTATADARAILASAQAALKQVQTVTYTVEATATGGIAARAATGTGQLRVKRTTPPANPMVLATGTMKLAQETEPRTFHVSLGAEGAYVINAIDKQFHHGDPAGSGVMLMPIQYMLMPIYVAPDPFAPELKESIFTIEPDERVGDVDCHVVSIGPESAPVRVRYAIGKQDSLPRKIERIFNNAQFMGVVGLIATNLEVNAPMPDEMFVLKAPEGYKSIEMEAPGNLLKVGTVAPEWELKTPEGTTVSLKSLAGRVVLIDFWATWCGPCKQAMPGVQKLHEKFKDKPVSVFGITTGERGDPAKYMKEKGFTYGLLLNGDAVAGKYRVSGIPTFYLIGPDGKVLHSSSGFNPAAESRIAGLIEKALASAPASQPSASQPAASAPSAAGS